MATRKELIEGVGKRYRTSKRGDKGKILDEFVALTGYHRKHAIRVLSSEPKPRGQRVRRCLYDEAVRQTLVLLWEASDRLCSKRLKALLPTLIETMQRHQHLQLDAAVKGKLASISAASIDRILLPTREQAGRGRKHRTGMGSVIRRSVPIRTFSDWKDPPPGFFEVDLVEHCGGAKYDGNFVHSLVLTDIASGWTECVALPVREQTLVVEGFAKVRADLAFAVRGLDTDNDSVFMNDTVFKYCNVNALELTRSRAYKKNDQAWVEQKNGAVVRRLVGYERLSGLAATAALAELYVHSRLYVNFFQPSFKLKAKQRDGAKVRKQYFEPKTPYERLLEHKAIEEGVKERLRAQFAKLDPIALLQHIRAAQSKLAQLSAGQVRSPGQPKADLGEFLTSLSRAWQDGEARPTHRKKVAAVRWWRSRLDPFADSWPTVQRWLEEAPHTTAKELMQRLRATLPDVYPTMAQLRTLQRRVKAWKQQRVKELITGKIDNTHCAHDGVRA